MSQWLLPVLVLSAALATTYLFCLRPMRRGTSCVHVPPVPPPSSEAELDRALLEARRELADHRARTGKLSPSAAGQRSDHSV